MTTPRNRFTITPFLVAFFCALGALPETNVVKVNALGMGHEHENPWRRRYNGIVAAAIHAYGWLYAAINRAMERPLVGPAIGALALLLLVMCPGAFAFGVLTEGQHAGEFLVCEFPGVGYPSRENVTVLSGQNLTAGAVVGRVSRGVGLAAIPAVVGTGNGTMSKLFAGPEVQRGNYVVKCTALAANGGTFSVTNPSGKLLPAFVMAAGSGGQVVAYTSREINFTVTDGGTDFAVNDTFTIVVTTGSPTVVGTGNGTLTAITLGPDAQTGRYRVECTAAVTNGGTFQVISPDGQSLGSFIMTAGAGTATAFTNRQLNFTLTDAGTDFVVGDFFEVFAFNELNGGKVVAWDPTAVDGRQTAVGLLFDNVNASAADLAGVIVTRNAEVLKGSLQWAAAITAAQKESAYLDLAKRGVIAR